MGSRRNLGLVTVSQFTMLKNKMNNRKGIVFTLDAVLSLVILVTMVMGILFFLNQQTDLVYNRNSLDTIARDSLTVLEKNNNLRNAVNINNLEVVNRFMNALPSHICSSIILYDSFDNEVLTSTKSGCGTAIQRSVARRAFVTLGRNRYTAEMTVWFNEN
jgi:hypothetical protein